MCVWPVLSSARRAFCGIGSISQSAGLLARLFQIRSERENPERHRQRATGQYKCSKDSSDSAILRHNLGEFDRLLVAFFRLQVENERVRGFLALNALHLGCQGWLRIKIQKDRHELRRQ